MTKRELIVVRELRVTLQQLTRATKLCSTSLDKCSTMEYGMELSDTQLESFEAFTSRFSRLCDLLYVKVFRLIDTLELIESTSMIDRLNAAEKRGLIGTVSQAREIRELRNEIAHEYSLEDMGRLIKDVTSSAPLLIDAAEKTLQYCVRFSDELI